MWFDAHFFARRVLYDTVGKWDEQTVLTVCPWNVLMGRSWPSLHTWMHMSVLQEANVLLLCQSTSRAGAVYRQLFTCLRLILALHMQPNKHL